MAIFNIAHQKVEVLLHNILDSSEVGTVILIGNISDVLSGNIFTFLFSLSFSSDTSLMYI